MNNLKFEDLPKAMEQLLKKLELLEEELKNIKQNYQPIKPVELMTRKEVVDFLKFPFQPYTNGLIMGF
ncbi:MAG: hypothetical protein ACKVJF_03015 [Flavobacteriales bacterium]